VIGERSAGHEKESEPKHRGPDVAAATRLHAADNRRGAACIPRLTTASGRRGRGRIFEFAPECQRPPAAPKARMPLSRSVLCALLVACGSSSPPSGATDANGGTPESGGSGAADGGEDTSRNDAPDSGRDSASTPEFEAGGPCVNEGSPCGTEQAGICCSGRCVAHDAVNCGGCGDVCPSPKVCVGQSSSWGCSLFVQDCSSQPRQVAGSPVCALPGGGYGSCCGGHCIAAYYSIDSNDCGACGRICPAGSQCQGTCTAGGKPAVCDPLTPEQCPSGYQCQAGYCIIKACSTATEGYACQAGVTSYGVCCAGSCVNYLWDPANCGGCGIACAGGSCNSGTCQ
jgi:hypothetical protein